MIKWGATIMRPISKKESYTRDRLINDISGSFGNLQDRFSQKKKKDRFSHFNMATNWLYKIG